LQDTCIERLLEVPPPPQSMRLAGAHKAVTHIEFCPVSRHLALAFADGLVVHFVFSNQTQRSIVVPVC
jgi:hypothetical protein